MRYRPDIDGLRALSVLGVLFYHLDHSYLPGGFTGVDVFFVISGFVVTGAMEGRTRDRLFGFMADFYARRLARIVPALVLTLGVTILLDVLFIPVSWLSNQNVTLGLSAFFGVSNWVLQKGQETYFTPRLDYDPYLHTWSLGVEEQFYLLAPLMLFFVLRSDRQELRPWVTGLLLILAFASLGFAAFTTSSMPTLAFYSVFSRFFELAAGVLLYLMTSGVNNPNSGRFDKWTAGFGLALIVLSFWRADETQMPWPCALMPVFGALLLIGGARLEPRDPLRRLLSAQPCVWLGKRSYALYLWHWPVDVVLRWTTGLESISARICAILISLLLAAMSTALIEKPLRHHPALERWPRMGRIYFFLALVIAGAGISNFLFDHRARLSLSQVSRHEYDWYAGHRMFAPKLGVRQCAVKINEVPLPFGSVTQFLPERCSEGESKTALYVVGDSHALMLAPSLEQASAELGLRVNLLSLEGCPYLNFRNPLKEREPRCQKHFEPLKRYLLEEGRSGDLILIANLMLMRFADQNQRYPIPDMQAYLYGGNYAERAQVVHAEIEALLRVYQEKGLRVILWAPPPIYKAPTFRCSDWFNRHNPICEGDGQMSQHELGALRGPILAEMKRLEESGVTVFDAFPILCPEETCRVMAPNGRPLFFDGDHLSRYGNEVIYPAFKAILVRSGVQPVPPKPKTP
jgi:peptidoglycan/LPS O-acetylase OafA/YrhL